MRAWKAAVLTGVLLAIANSGAVAKPASMIVREQRTVVINGVTETWQLVWIGKPQEFCPASDIEMAITCPCDGVAYGEYGNLWLIRKRQGHEVERMDLRPLFKGDWGYANDEKTSGKAFLQRYPMRDSDYDNRDLTQPDPALTAGIRRRPAPVIMTFADYDHDGQATEFLLDVGTMPCGKLQFIAVGVSAHNPHLHALASAETPREPLRMPAGPWRVLLKSSRPTRVITWECGDHGSEVQSNMTVSAKNGIIRTKERDIVCTTDQVRRGGYNGSTQ
jgi:hypothetical protein